MRSSLSLYECTARELECKTGSSMDKSNRCSTVYFIIVELIVLQERMEGLLWAVSWMSINGLLLERWMPWRSLWVRKLLIRHRHPAMLSCATTVCPVLGSTWEKFVWFRERGRSNDQSLNTWLLQSQREQKAADVVSLQIDERMLPWRKGQFVLSCPLGVGWGAISWNNSKADLGYSEKMFRDSSEPVKQCLTRQGMGCS